MAHRDDEEDYTPGDNAFDESSETSGVEEQEEKPFEWAVLEDALVVKVQNAIPSVAVKRSMLPLEAPTRMRLIQDINVAKALDQQHLPAFYQSLILSKPMLLGQGHILTGASSAVQQRHSLVFTSLCSQAGSSAREVIVGGPVHDLRWYYDESVVAAVGTTVAVLRSPAGSRKDVGHFVKAGDLVDPVVDLGVEIRELAMSRETMRLACATAERRVSVLTAQEGGGIGLPAAGAGAGFDGGGVVSSVRWGCEAGASLLSWTTEDGSLVVADTRVASGNSGDCGFDRIGAAGAAAGPALVQRTAVDQGTFSHAWIDENLIACGGARGRLQFMDRRRADTAVASMDDPALMAIGDIQALRAGDNGVGRCGCGGGGGAGGGGAGGGAAALVLFGLGGVSIWDVRGGPHGLAHAQRCYLAVPGSVTAAVPHAGPGRHIGLVGGGGGGGSDSGGADDEVRKLAAAAVAVATGLPPPMLPTPKYSWCTGSADGEVNGDGVLITVASNDDSWVRIYAC